MKTLLWTETAKRDLQQIYNYIRTDSVYYANRFVDGLIEKAETVNIFPGSGRVVPEIGKENIREVFYHSYRIMYEIANEYIYITQISHMAQDFMDRSKN